MSLKLGHIALFTLLLVAEQIPYLAGWILGERSLLIGLRFFILMSSLKCVCYLISRENMGIHVKSKIT